MLPPGANKLSSRKNENVNFTSGKKTQEGNSYDTSSMLKKSYLSLLPSPIFAIRPLIRSPIKKKKKKLYPLREIILPNQPESKLEGNQEIGKFLSDVFCLGEESAN